jgi:RNA-directed DNA polymerase
LPVRERMIPKSGGKLRRLGIPTVRDRVVQAALKLVLEPIFEAGFQPCCYGFRPRRRAQDAIAEIHQFHNHGYRWVLEADIEACFDSIDHTALMDRVRRRVGDKGVLTLVKAFLKAGILTVDGAELGTVTGTPQGGILSPLLANIALSALDDYLAEIWQATKTSNRRQGIRKRGGATYRLVRYADDFVVMVYGTREHAEALRAQVTQVLAPLGLRLSEAKTSVVHFDDGFDFLGWRIQRRRKRGTAQRYLYTYPSKKALPSVMARVRTLTRRANNRTLSDLLHRLNPVLRGWATYFRHGVSKQTFSYLGQFAWQRVVGWLRKRHPGISWARLRRHFLPGWRPTQEGISLFNPATITVTRYRYRATRSLSLDSNNHRGLTQRHGLVESRMLGTGTSGSAYRSRRTRVRAEPAPRPLGTHRRPDHPRSRPRHVHRTRVLSLTPGPQTATAWFRPRRFRSTQQRLLGFA